MVAQVKMLPEPASWLDLLYVLNNAVGFWESEVLEKPWLWTSEADKVYVYGVMWSPYFSIIVLYIDLDDRMILINLNKINFRNLYY